MIHWLKVFFLAASLLSGAIVGHAHVPSVSIVEDEKSPFRGVTIGAQACSLEEDPTGLLNEGFRYRCLETGIFITRDPAGFIDGPNLYTYVRQNPWTMFDPKGLFESFVYQPGYGAQFVSEQPAITGQQAASFTADVIFNSDAIRDSYQFAKEADRSSIRGWGETAIGGVGVLANTIDAGANILTGGLKGIATGVVEKGLKEGVEKIATKSAQNIVQETDQIVKEITINASKHPEAAKHIEDAQQAGKPSVITVDRSNAVNQRKLALEGKEKVTGKQLDEYPPAFSKEGGKGASVRPINPKDNMGAGAAMGNQLRKVKDGEKVKISVKREKELEK
jgi:RHS repeat-associated protein